MSETGLADPIQRGWSFYRENRYDEALTFFDDFL